MFKYKIPQEIKVKFTKEFMTYFLDRLTVTFDLDESMLCSECFVYLEGTIGWVNSFEYACQRYNLEDVFVYYDKLEWYDSDLFDGELGDILVEHKLIKGF